jgi:hypothetical protein
MGLLIDGKWHDQWYDTTASGGRFIRSESQFRNWITTDGAPAANGESGFEAEADRYHLYVSLACPWAHRTLIMRPQGTGGHDFGVDRTLADARGRLDLQARTGGHSHKELPL